MALHSLGIETYVLYNLEGYYKNHLHLQPLPPCAKEEEAFGGSGSLFLPFPKGERDLEIEVPGVL